MFLILDALVMIAVCFYAGVTAWRKIAGEQISAHIGKQINTLYFQDHGLLGALAYSSVEFQKFGR